MAGRLLILNADDLGWTPGVNDGIFATHARGVVSSATLMVNAPGAAHAVAALARPELAALGVGLHVTLTGGGPTTLPPAEVPSLVDAHGRLPRRPDGLAGARPTEILAEVRAQLARFEALVGRAPTHLDGHHHVHRRPEVLAQVTAVAAAAGLPVRQVDAAMRAELRRAGIATTDFFDASFFAAGVSRERLVESFKRLPAGLSEIMCHPGRVDAELERSSTYTADREIEIDILSDPAVTAALAAEDIRLVSYTAL